MCYPVYYTAGLAGSAPLAIGAGSIADLFSEESRAGAMGIFTLGPLLGPVIVCLWLRSIQRSLKTNHYST